MPATDVGVEGGGNVTFLVAPTANHGVMIRRYTALKNNTNLRDQEEYRPSEVERALDTAIFEIQRLQDDIERAPRTPESQATATMAIPQVTLRANRALMFDASGNVIASPLIDSTAEYMVATQTREFIMPTDDPEVGEVVQVQSFDADTVTFEWGAGGGGGGGGASNSFTTIACSSGTNPVADSSTDTLTLTGTSPITVTGNAATDTVTIALSGTTGSGNVVLATSPTITTPTIASFANATHSHQNAAGGGTLDTGAIATGTFGTAFIANDAITYAKLQNVAGFSVVGKATTGAGDAADITAGTDSVLGRDGSGNLAFAAIVAGQIASNAVTTAKILDANVTKAKIENVAASKLLGRGDSGAGAPQEITLGTGLSMSGTTLSSSGGGGGITLEEAQDGIGTILLDSSTIDFTYDDATPTITAVVIDDSITYAKIQNVSGSDKLLGRISGAGDPEEITCTAAGRALLDDAAASDQRTTLGLGTIATLSSTNPTLVGATFTDNVLIDNEKALHLGDAAGTEKIIIKAPSLLVGDWTMTLPSDAGVAGQALAFGTTCAWVDRKMLLTYHFDAPAGTKIRYGYRIPKAATITKVQAYRVGGTSASVQVLKGGADVLSSDLSTTADTWVNTTSFVSSSLAADDSIAFEITALSGTATSITVQLEANVTA